MKSAIAPTLVCLAALTSAPCAFAQLGLDGSVQRLSATFRFFGSERSTTLKPLPGATGGATIFARTVTIPAGVNVLYVSMYTTGDAHAGARILFACRISVIFGLFSPCQPAAANPAGAAPTGWITLQRHRDYNRDYLPRTGVNPFNGDAAGGAGDLHDNAISYQWCVKVPFSETPYTRIVQLRMGSLGDPTSLAIAPVVFIEGLHVFVDASYVSNAAGRCVADTSTLPAEEPDAAPQP